MNDHEIRLVVTDLMMPELNGFELIEEIRKRESRYTYILVLSSLGDKSSVVRALSLGADDYICKPSFVEELHLRVAAGVRLLKLESHDALVFSMAELAACHSGETGYHLRRVRDFVRVLALDLAEARPDLLITCNWVEELAQVSVLHDIGKVAVPDSILHKPGKLMPAEYEIIKSHASVGGELLKTIFEQTGAGYLRLAYQVTMHHHERWDGNGYPEGLAGEQIPLAARIMALADVFDALTSQRCYKEPLSYEKAREIVLAERGHHFDPMVVDAYLRCEEEWRQVLDRFVDDWSEEMYEA